MLVYFFSLFGLPIASRVLHHRWALWRRLKLSRIIFALWLLCLIPVCAVATVTVAELAWTQPALADVGLTRYTAGAAGVYTISSPYAPGTAVLTQGPHGHSYGHAAIDLSGGEGTPVYAPIDGAARLSMDGYGNTVLVIENERLEATLLHGKWTVQRGAQVRRGELVGFEDNYGYTMSNGVLCHNRPGCGDHTHLNVRDKLLSTNVDLSRLLAGDITLGATPGGKPLKISWYDPALGGVNCDHDCTTMASGVRVTPDRYGRTAACIRSWTAARRVVVIPGIGEFECLDTGGKIQEHADYIWIDLMLKAPAVPFGTLVQEYYVR